MAEEGICKATDTLARSTIEACYKRSNRIDKTGAALDAYCACVGDRMVDNWHKHSGALSSKSMVSMETQAFGQCN